MLTLRATDISLYSWLLSGTPEGATSGAHSVLCQTTQGRSLMADPLHVLEWLACAVQIVCNSYGARTRGNMTVPSVWGGTTS